jgi:hypothetical protein
MEHTTFKIASFDSYLDYSVLQIVNPKFILVEGNFFYNAHAELAGPTVGQLIMRGNIYSLDQRSGNNSIAIQKGATCNKVSIENYINGEQAEGLVAFVRQTRVRRSLSQKGALEWWFNFENDLVFGQIDSILYLL